LDSRNAPGASVHDDGVSFRVWAPRCQSVDLVFEGRPPLAMSRGDEGIFEMTVPRVGAGARYQYRLDGERHRPDPTSRWQPDGVHGPSRVYDHSAFTWTDRAWADHGFGERTGT